MTDFNEVINSVSAPEAVIMLLSIDHASLTNPVRFVADYQDFIHLTNTYSPLAFEVILPTETDTGMPTAQLRMGNLGKELMQALLDTHGLIGSKGTITQVLKSDPDVKQYEITLFLNDINTTDDTLDCRLEYTNIYSTQAFRKTYNPTTAPGLF